MPVVYCWPFCVEHDDRGHPALFRAHLFEAHGLEVTEHPVDTIARALSGVTVYGCCSCTSTFDDEEVVLNHLVRIHHILFPIDGSEVSDDLIASSDPAPIEVDDVHDQVPIGTGGTHGAAPVLAGNKPMVYQAFRAQFLRFTDGLFAYLLLLIAFFSTLIQGLAQRVAGVRLQARTVAAQAAFSRFFPAIVPTAIGIGPATRENVLASADQHRIPAIQPDADPNSTTIRYIYMMLILSVIRIIYLHNNSKQLSFISSALEANKLAV